MPNIVDYRGKDAAGAPAGRHVEDKAEAERGFVVLFFSGARDCLTEPAQEGAPSMPIQ